MSSQGIGGDDRHLEITGPVTNSPIMSGNFSGPVTQTYSGTTTVSTGSITVNKQYLEKMLPEFRESFDKLIDTINNELKQDGSITSDKLSDLQSSTNQLAKEVSEVNPNEKLTPSKGYGLMGALKNFGRAVVKASPKIAQAVIAMTPLAPLSSIVGESLEQVVKEAMKEKDEN